MFPISLLSFSRNKQGFRLSLEKTLEVPVLLRVNTEHTSLSSKGRVRHSPMPCKAIAVNEAWGPGWYESSAPTWLQEQSSCTASVQDVLINSGERRLNDLSLFSPARHSLRGDLIAVH